TIDVTTSPTSNEGNKYNLALGAKITPTMSYDSYSGTFVLAATGNGYDYHIGFTDNATTLPDDIYGNTQSDTVTIPTKIPTKDGFVFQGWCSQATAVNPSTFVTTCPNGATVYQPGATITLDGTSANNLLLYAIWNKGYDTFAAAFAGAGKTDSDKTNGYFRMQDITPEICDSVVIGSPYATADIAKNTLIDTRNSKTYLVAKYADGHCWMRENLNLVLTKDSNVDAYNFETKEVMSYTPNNSTQTTTGSSYPWAEDASDGTRSLNIDKDDCIGGTDINTSGGSGATCDANKPYERIGVLYNWAAATAQTGDQAKNAGSSGEQVIPTSICPKGWRLPANSGDYSFSTLMGSYGLPTTNQVSLTSANNYSGQLQNPLNFNRPGNYYWSAGALHGRGTGGWFWSSVAYSTASAHVLHFLSAAFYPQSGNAKGYGFSVRCVAV
ncbi:InlB B-repeat-containing protein, partial [Candidatus Saccharibacteria bacterium]|nr:InlB B-repeat-containing protein [Candidatus Saccharibacteria bacterium]